jgi:choline dehydrogenase-like flavoprotein
MIDPAYLSNQADLDFLAQSVKFCRELALTEPLKSVTKALTSPGPEVTSDEHYKAYVKKHVTTAFHPIGTASMLPREDGGVVSPNLVVYGTKNLRIVSLSVGSASAKDLIDPL